MSTANLESKPSRVEGNSWQSAHLKDVATVISGQSPPSHTYRKEPIGLPFFQGKADFGQRHPVARSWCVEPVKIAEPGDILISVRAPVGPTNVAEERCCIGRGLAAIRCGEQLDREFLLYVLKLFEEDIAGQGSGSTFKSISRKHLLELQVPLPPLEEQRRIAQRLDEQMAEAEKALAAAKVSAETAELLPAAYLNQAFGHDEIQQWCSVSLESVSEIISGVALGRKLNGVQTRPVHYLRVANVKDGSLDLAHVKTVQATERDIEKLALRRGDLLLTEGGDRDKLGRGTIWNEELDLCIHQNHLFRVRLDQTQCLPEFVAAQLSSAYGKAYFFAHGKQTTGIATINQRVLRRFPLLLPPLSEQQRIIRQLTEYRTFAKQVQTSISEQVAALETLPSRLISAMFEGGSQLGRE